MNFRLSKIISGLVFSLLLFVFACSTDDISYNYPDNQDYARNNRAGKLFGKDAVLFGGKNSRKISKTELWKASVEVIESLFPIAATDKNLGIIATQWYQKDEKSDSRIKINTLVRGAKITQNNLRISIFHQKKNDQGEWEASGFDDEQKEKDDLSIKLIKDKILQKALEKD